MRLILGLLLAFLMGLWIACFDTAFGGTKYFLTPYKVLDTVSFSSAATVSSAAVDVHAFDNIAVQFNTGTGSTNSGTFFVDVSEDHQESAGVVLNAGNWTSLPFNPTPIVSGPAAAVIYQDINQTGAQWMRVRYVPTATGAGTYTVWLGGKMEGG